MDNNLLTPPGIFGHSRKSALKYGDDFSKSGRKVRFDDSQIETQLYEIQAERECEKIDRDQEQMAQKIVDDMLAKLNGIPFGAAFNTPPPMDPRQQIIEAREKMNSLLTSSPPRFTTTSYAVNTPPVNSFNTSRYGPIGTGRPSSNIQSSFKYSTSGIPFRSSENFNSSTFNTSNRFGPLFSQPGKEDGLTPSTFNTSNKFNSSSFQDSKNFNSSSKSFNSSSIRRTTDSYKTALCNLYKDTGKCSYGDECKYAHGIDELRTPPSAKPNYKTVLCRNFHEKNQCPHGARCKFIHHRREGNAFQNSSTSNFAASRNHC